MSAYLSARIEARNERKRCLLDVEHLAETTRCLDASVDDVLGSVEESVFEELGSVLPDLVVRPPAFKKLCVSVMHEGVSDLALRVDPELSAVHAEAMTDFCDDVSLEDLMLPDVVVRPSPYDKLHVTVSSDTDKPREWESEIALSIFPELLQLPEAATREDRLHLLQTVDRNAFLHASPTPHLPPVLH